MAQRDKNDEENLARTKGYRAVKRFTDKDPLGFTPDIENRKAFAERLRASLPREMTYKEVAAEIGASVSGIKKWLAGSSEPGLEYLRRLSALTGKSLDWLAFGEEEEPREVRQKKPQGAQPLDTRGPVDPLYWKIPIYDIEASAGDGSNLHEERIIDWIFFRGLWFKNFVGVRPKNAAFVMARGDSMEPTIRHGDLVLVDTGRTAIDEDTIYLIRSNDRFKITRLHLSPSARLTIRSDNPSYPEDVLESTELGLVAILGRVCMITRAV